MNDSCMRPLPSCRAVCMWGGSTGRLSGIATGTCIMGSIVIVWPHYMKGSNRAPPIVFSSVSKLKNKQTSKQKTFFIICWFLEFPKQKVRHWHDPIPKWTQLCDYVSFIQVIYSFNGGICMDSEFCQFSLIFIDRKMFSQNNNLFLLNTLQFIVL